MGKTFSAADLPIQNILKNPDIEAYSKVLEENVMLKSDYKQMIGIAKGVDGNYEGINNFKKLMIAGKYFVSDDEGYGVFGIGVAGLLGVNIPALKPISIWIPDRNYINSMRPESAFRTMYIMPSGVAEVEEAFDSGYLICSLKKLQELTNRDTNQVSNIEIKLKPTADIEATKQAIAKQLEGKYIVKNRAEQYDMLYSVMKSEKLATFLILSFIILIAGFSITSSVIILIIEKKEDMKKLLHMGIQLREIQKIFLFQGLLIAGIAAGIGLAIGASIIILQDYFEFISYSASNDGLRIAYPVALQINDLIYSFFSVIIIGTMITIFPLMRIKKFIQT